MDLVKQATGASFVRAFDHNIRSGQGKANRKRIKDGQEVQGAAHMVHGDYTLTSALQRLSDLADSPKSNDNLNSVLGSSHLYRDILPKRQFKARNVLQLLTCGEISAPLL